MFEKGFVVNGRYEVERLIATGGTSSVYLVMDRHIGRRLAMKVMDRMAMRFAKSEIESLRTVRYPLFPEIHDAFADEDRIYLLCEYVDGTTLSELLKKKSIPKNRALILMSHVCNALIYLHGMKRPILYLDLKPENIIVDKSGLPHLIDFGIAIWLAARFVPVGTRGYSPPEQYRPDGVMDERSDIFAFGMTYYSIRCFHPPAPDVHKALSDIRSSPVLSGLEKSFLLKCCAPKKEDRFKNASEVLRHLEKIRSVPKRIIRSAAAAVLLAAVIVSAGYTANAINKRNAENKAAEELLRNAAVHMEDGEYTREGIGVIRAAISSGQLSKEQEAEYIFEVAKNAMFISKDYRLAAVYFAKLDKDKYPEASDYMKLCRMLNGFSFDPDMAEEVTGRLFSDIYRRSPSRMKYENLIFIADCFEHYDRDRVRGLSKALSVLYMEKEELEMLKDKDGGALSGDGFDDVYERVVRLLQVKEEKLKIIKHGKVKVGE